MELDKSWKLQIKNPQIFMASLNACKPNLNYGSIYMAAKNEEKLRNNQAKELIFNICRVILFNTPKTSLCDQHFVLIGATT